MNQLKEWAEAVGEGGGGSDELSTRCDGEPKASRELRAELGSLGMGVRTAGWERPWSSRWEAGTIEGWGGKGNCR